MSFRSNLSVLTQSHKAIAAKKRAKKDQIKEVVFDDDARRYVHFAVLFVSFHSFGDGIDDMCDIVAVTESDPLMFQGVLNGLS